MPITLNCPKCHKPFRVRDESIGGRVRCPSCGAVLQVPSALSPASHFGDDPRAEGGGSPGARMAEDFPIGASRMGGAGDMLMGAAAREGAVDLNPPAGGPTAGPPSIRNPVPGMPPPAPVSAPTRAPAPQPPAPQRVEPPKRPPFPIPGNIDPAWSAVRGGLGMIRWGLLLCALIILFLLGHGAWVVLDPDSALKMGPGFLGKEAWPRWKEVMVAYTAVPLVPAVLLLLLGRLRCAGAPGEAHARSLALGAAFFTILGLVAVGLVVALKVSTLDETLKLPAVFKDVHTYSVLGMTLTLTTAQLTLLIAAVPSAVLADVLTLLFIGQIGWPVRRPSLQKSAAGVFVFAGILAAGIPIGHLFYPVLDAALESMRQGASPLGAGDDNEQAKRVMIWSVIIVAAVLLFFLRYAAVAGAGRRAVRRYMAGQA